MIPRLTTARLVLDAFTMDDVPALVELAGHPEIFATTGRIEHPYTAEHAQRYIAGHLPAFLSGESVTFAIRREGRLIGDVALFIKRAHDRGRLGYWIGRPYWGNGYATEAVRTVVVFGFQHYQLEKIDADYFAGNAASGRVMEKAGMAREGFHPRHYKKGETYLDAISHGVTRAGAIAAGLLGENTPGAAQNFPATPVKKRGPHDPPFAEELVAPGANSIERARVMRHFLGKTVAELEQELRVYGKSLVSDFGSLAPEALDYYLRSAQAYLTSDFSDGDWDFAHGIVSALALQLRGGALPPGAVERAQAAIRQVRDHAARYFIETDKPPFSNWLAETLPEG